MAERQTQPPQKRPGQLVWVQIPLSPPRTRPFLRAFFCFGLPLDEELALLRWYREQMGSIGTTQRIPGWRLIQLGTVLMAFGVGGFLGFAVASERHVATGTPAAPAVAPVVITRAETHANAADYLARRLTLGISKLENTGTNCRKL
jgi:hypothetical protein